MEMRDQVGFLLNMHIFYIQRSKTFNLRHHCNTKTLRYTILLHILLLRINCNFYIALSHIAILVIFQPYFKGNGISTLFFCPHLYTTHLMAIAINNYMMYFLNDTKYSTPQRQYPRGTRDSHRVPSRLQMFQGCPGSLQQFVDIRDRVPGVADQGGGGPF